MIISKSSFSKLSDLKRIHFTCNCYHVEVNDGEKMIFERRNPSNNEWMDEKHRRIALALSELESAILDVVD